MLEASKYSDHTAFASGVDEVKHVEEDAAEERR